MPRASTIPFPVSSMEAVNQGAAFTQNIFNNLLNKQKMQMQQEQLNQAAQMQPIEKAYKQALTQKYMMDVDPAKKMAYINQVMAGLTSTPQGGVQGSSGNAFGNLTPQQVQSIKLGLAGIKIPTVTETPEQKRAADLEKQKELAKFTSDLTTQRNVEKENEALKTDLPKLEEAYNGANQLLYINETNPDMFGHNFAPDLYTKTTKNENFGSWTTLLNDQIADLTKKLASRQNVTALKFSIANKPSHAEQQEVAHGKIQSIRDNLLQRINVSRKKLGMEPLQETYNWRTTDESLKKAYDFLKDKMPDATPENILKEAQDKNMTVGQVVMALKNIHDRMR